MHKIDLKCKIIFIKQNQQKEILKQKFLSLEVNYIDNEIFINISEWDLLCWCVCG